MTPEQQAYYENQFSMFGERGWKDLIEDFQGIRDATDRISGVKPEDLRFKQGELSIINLILNREAVWREAYDELSRDEAQPGE